MAAKDVFISYKAEEVAEALWLKGVLESNGISCWMAPTSIPGGSNYAQEIPSAIESCKVFVLMLSSRAQESMWISKELNMALNEHKVIMPFMLENCSLHKEFNFYLSDVQRYDAFQSKADAVRKMVNEIHAIQSCAKDVPEKAPVVNIPVQPQPIYAKPAEKKPVLKLWHWILITYLTLLPAGLAVTIAYFLGRFNDLYGEKILRITKILCILCSVFGIFLILFGIVNHSHCHEALYFSIIGLLTEFLFFV